MMSRRLLTLLLVSTLAVAGCTKDDTLKTVPHADASRLVEQYRESLPGIVGENTKLVQTNTILTPCDDTDDAHIYSAVAHGQIFLPGEKHLDALQRVKADLTAKGFAVTEERTYTGGKAGGLLRMQNGADEVTVRLLSTDPAEAFAVLVASPCYFSEETL